VECENEEEGRLATTGMVPMGFKVGSDRHNAENASRRAGRRQERQLARSMKILDVSHVNFRTCWLTTDFSKQVNAANNGACVN